MSLARADSVRGGALAPKAVVRPGIPAAPHTIDAPPLRARVDAFVRRRPALTFALSAGVGWLLAKLLRRARR